MGGEIPSQCPECGAITIDTFLVPPSEHDHGNDWWTRAECRTCDSYVEWFD